MRKNMILSLALIFGLFNILLNANGNNGMPVKIEKAEVHTLLQTYKTFGTIKSDSSSNIEVSSQCDGKISEKFYTIGDKVKQNSLLVTIETKEAQALSEIDGYEIKNKQIFAPISGYIAEDFVYVGDVINAGQPIVRIVSNTHKYLSVNIPNRFRPYIKNGAKISVISDAKRFQTELKKIIPVTNPLNNTFEAIAFIQNENLFIGSVCEVIVTIDKKDVLAVRRDAILTKNDKKILFVAEDGKAIKKEVQIGIKTDKFIEITSGIEIGDEVIFLGNYELEGGMKIRIKNQ